MPRIQHKRGTSANLASVNPTPLAGELVWDSTENAIKIGDGATAWTSLAYVTATPRTHTHSADAITSGTIDYARLPVGSTTSTVCAGDDARLTDARAPTAHKSTHATGGSDALTPGDIGAAPAASPAFTGAATFVNTGNVVPLTVVNTGTGNSFVVQDESSDSSPFLIDADGRVAIGHSTPTSLVELRAPTATPPQLRITSTGAAGNAASPASRGSIAFPNFNLARELVTLTSVGREGSFLAGYFQISVANASGTSESVFTIDNQSTAATFGVRTTLPLHVSSVINVNATSGSAGSYLPSVCISGDPNTGFGQVSGQSDTASVFTAGQERVRVTATGNIGIGSSGNSLTRFLLGGDVSGAGTNFILLASPTAQSAVTTLYGCLTFPSVAADCALATLYHYGAQQGTTVAGTISTQIGYWAHSGLTSATNNYAFRADIASGTGRWNFFANGTAANYFAGNVGIGSGRTSPSTALDVNGVITVSATSGSAGSYAPSLCISGDPNTGFGQVSGESDSASIFTAGHERVRVKSTGAVRFVPLTADPGTADAGDVYYNSSTNKLRVYNGTSWVDLH